MNGQVAAGIAAGVAGLGAAVGLHMVMRGGSRGNEAGAEAEWNAWKGELDQEFPKVGSDEGMSRRPLFDDSDQQRFEEFLAEHPAPKWINVKHDDLRAISIDPFEPDAKGHQWTALAAGALGIGGGIAAGFTGAMMLDRAGPAGSKLGVALNVGGAVLGIATIASSFFLPKSDLYDRIEASEWNVPTSWTE